MQNRSKISLIAFLVIVFFTSCKKKVIYSCSCEASVAWVMVGEPPNPSGIWYYSSLQSINEKLTKEKASDVCKATQLTFASTILKRHGYGSGDGYSINVLTNTCVIK